MEQGEGASQARRSQVAQDDAQAQDEAPREEGLRPPFASFLGKPARAAGRVQLLLDNRSGYSTGDLRAFFAKGLRALGVREPKRIIVVSAPARSRGCAEVGQRGREGEAIVIAIASPSHFSLRRLARLFEHEVGHTKGLDHGDMHDNLLWSLGAVPAWAEGMKIRYRGRAPSQL